MPWITPNVLVQQSNEPLSNIIEKPDFSPPSPTNRRHYIHIVNPYKCPPGSDASRTQEITFGSFLDARNFAAETADVQFVGVGFPEDITMFPDFFRQADCLDRSVLDIESFKVPHKFPLLFDVLERGVMASQQSDYVIFTNVDIVLMPQFYRAIGNLLDLGFEALTITRRTIPFYGLNRHLIPLMGSDHGVPHPGFDCFVFPARFCREFVRSNACIGAGMAMRSLLYNLATLARPLLILKGAHMTFHMGNDRTWRSPEQRDYTDYNVRNARQVFSALSDNPKTKRLIEQFCISHGESGEIMTLNKRELYEKIRRIWRTLRRN